LLRSISRRFFTSQPDLSRLVAFLTETYPNEDPTQIKLSKIPGLLKKGNFFDDAIAPTQLERIHSEWKKEYEKKLHDSAYEEMADPGELSDGELHSWRNARLSVEKDPTFHVPDVTVHEGKRKK
jgi:hypothetical protein